MLLAMFPGFEILECATWYSQTNWPAWIFTRL